MKKFIKVLTIFIVGLSLVACGESASKNDGEYINQMGQRLKISGDTFEAIDAYGVVDAEGDINGNTVTFIRNSHDYSYELTFNESEGYMIISGFKLYNKFEFYNVKSEKGMKYVEKYNE